MDCPKKKCDMDAAARIPDDPLVEILSRVPFKSLCRFKCVSKAWRDLIADPHHRKQLPQTLEGFFLMFGQEQCESESSGDYYYSDDGDGEDFSTDGSDGEELPCQGYGFVDALGKSVRPVDFSFLTELGSIEKSMLLRSCNGLLLFLVDCTSDISKGYIVCNPATKQYVSVPSAPCSGGRRDEIVTYLLYDPGVSSHFHLVQFSKIRGYHPMVYSSETQGWSHNKCEWDYRYKRISPVSPSAYVNGMLHLILYSRKDKLAVVNVEGNIQNIFRLPCPAQTSWEKLFSYGYIGQSQGCLHYIYVDQNMSPRGLKWKSFDMSTGRRKWIGERLVIWVLQDYDKQQWVLKDTVSFLKLFGKRYCNLAECNVVGIHPDRNLVFLVQHWDWKLISYHMDNKEVRDLCTLEHGYKCIAPYVPHFSDFGA